MMRRLMHAAVILLALVGLSLSLRHDLADLALRQGNSRLLAGDLAGAEAAFRRAVALGSEAAPLAYNLGVSHYRRGEFAQAQRQFAAALATAGPALRGAIHYNLGNCGYRQGERLAASDRRAAGEMLRQAVADYGEALIQTPGAPDARSNLMLARTRLTALAGGRARDGNKRGGVAEQPRSPGGAAGKGPAAGTPQAGAQPASSRQKAAAGTREKSGGADAPADSGKSRRELTRNEVERLLNEARGREKPTGMPHGGKQNRPLAKPEKDW